MKLSVMLLATQQLLTNAKVRGLCRQFEESEEALARRPPFPTLMVQLTVYMLLQNSAKSCKDLHHVSEKNTTLALFLYNSVQKII